MRIVFLLPVILTAVHLRYKNRLPGDHATSLRPYRTLAAPLGRSRNP
jgi:hypothetical protein